MILNHHPIVAQYRMGPDREPPASRTMPVIAWEDDGTPLVMGRKALIPAHSITEIDGVPVLSWCIDDREPIPQVIPGGGWMVSYTHPNGDVHCEPVVAWQIDSQGLGQALGSDIEGYVDKLDGGDLKLRYWHPACEPSWRPEP
jgi:hypothetical protein